MKRWLTVLCLVWIAALAPAGADAAQDDPRLQPLFDRLTATTDAEEAAILTALIWGHWQHHPDPAVERQMRIGITASERGNVAAALGAFDAVVELAPDFAEGWNKRATLHYMAGNLSDSLSDVRHTLVLEPRHFGALAGLGHILLALGDEAGALRAYEEGLRINPHMAAIRREAERLRDKLQGDPT